MKQTKKSVVSYATLAFAVLCFAQFVPNYIQYQISPLGGVVMDQFGISNAQLSSLFSAPLIPSIFLSLVGGVLIDKLGYKWVIGAGLIVSCIGCTLRTFADTYAFLFVTTVMTGFTTCFINAGGGKIIGGLYGAENVPPKMGILMASVTVGMTLAMMTSARFDDLSAAFTLAAVLCATATILWFLVVKNQSDETAHDAFKASMIECLKVTVRCSGVWFVAIAMFFVMAANVLMGSFIPLALSSKGIDTVTAGSLGSCFTIGSLLGCFVAPAAVKVLKSQKKTLIVFALLAAPGVAFAWTAGGIVLPGLFLLLTGVMLGGLMPTLLALPIQLREIGPIYAGTAGGVVGTIQLLGAVIVPSYILVPIAGDSFPLLFVLGGLCPLMAALFSACIKDIP